MLFVLVFFAFLSSFVILSSTPLCFLSTHRSLQPRLHLHRVFSNRSWRYFCIIITAVTCVSLLVVRAEAMVPNPHQAVRAYADLPMSFEANRGHADRQVKFLAHGSGYDVLLTSSDVVLRLSNSAKLTMRMKFLGSRGHLSLEGLDALRGKSNYFLGNDPAKWRTDVPMYAKVRSTV